tara:strand:- start:115 stop:531 length:417 start_codon:yes stop_codon:yes gene_type:complete
MRILKPLFTTILFMSSLTAIEVIAGETDKNPVLQGCENVAWVRKNGRDFQECKKKGKIVCVGQKGGTFSNDAGKRRHSHYELPGYEGRGNGKGHEYKGMKQKTKLVNRYMRVDYGSEWHDHGGNPKNWTNFGAFSCHD